VHPNTVPAGNTALMHQNFLSILQIAITWERWCCTWLWWTCINSGTETLPYLLILPQIGSWPKSTSITVRPVLLVFNSSLPRRQVSFGSAVAAVACNRESNTLRLSTLTSIFWRWRRRFGVCQICSRTFRVRVDLA